MARFRKNPRLFGYNYAQNGAYFITNSTDYSSQYIHGVVKEVVRAQLLDLERRFPGVSVYYYALMPTHIHVVILLQQSSTSIPEIWRVFKSVTTVKSRQQGFLEKHLWQKNYYEHVVRSEEALKKIVQYIENNPFKECLPWGEVYGDRIPVIEV